MNLLRSFLMAGFECSTHRLPGGKRLDLVAATRHDTFATHDFNRLRNLGIHTVREGLRWHLIEQSAGVFEFSSMRSIADAATDLGLQVIWDLMHYGWPDHLDPLSAEFIAAFAQFARQFAIFHQQNYNTDDGLWVCPINEISYLAWAGGECASINPFLAHSGDRLKQNLVRAAIAATAAIRTVNPSAHFMYADPVIRILPNPMLQSRQLEVEHHNHSQYAAWDMLAGTQQPELGGDVKNIDLIGINYYPRNQWVDYGATLTIEDPRYTPFRSILTEVWQRYHRPIIVAETGTEGVARAAWFRYVVTETAAAVSNGVPIHGILLYPILNHPGWADERHCCNGLWDYADGNGEREVHLPLLDEILKHQELLEELHRQVHRRNSETT